MKVVLIFAALVAAVYANCGDDADCAGLGCDPHHEEAVCNKNVSPHMCTCQQIQHGNGKRNHPICTEDLDCMTMDCSHGDALCAPHNDEMRCECP